MTLTKTMPVFAVRVGHISGGWFVEDEPAENVAEALAQVRRRWLGDPSITTVQYTGSMKHGQWLTQENSPSN